MTTWTPTAEKVSTATLPPLVFSAPPPPPDMTTSILTQAEQIATAFTLPPPESNTRQTYPLQTMTTQKSVHHPVNQGLLIPAPPDPYLLPTFDLIEMKDKIERNLTSPAYQGRVFGDKQFAIPAYKYIIPIILVLCLLTTILFAVILSRRLRRGSSMSRASCVLLLSVATADALTMIVAFAEVTYMFSQSLVTCNSMILPFSSCKTMFILERLSAVPHAASTWFTVILAIQRYVCVSFPFVAGKYINIKQSTVCILIVSVLSIGMHMCRFLDTNFVEVLIDHPSMPGHVIQTCMATYMLWISDTVLYESVFAWIRIVTTQLVPCIFIMTFVVLMLKTFENMKLVAKHMQVTGTKQQSERRHLSRFVIVISSIVFCVEFSNALFLSFNAWEISTGSVLLTHETLKAASLGFDLVLYVSYFLMFTLYCTMSGKFRETLASLIPVKCYDKYKAKGGDVRVRKKTLDSSHVKTNKTSVSVSLSNTLSWKENIIDYIRVEKSRIYRE